MKDFKLYTQFNFAKCVHLTLISVPEGNLCSSPEGISDFIKPYLQVLPVESLILTLFKALSRTLSKTSNQTTITKS